MPRARSASPARSRRQKDVKTDCCACEWEDDDLKVTLFCGHRSVSVNEEELWSESPLSALHYDPQDKHMNGRRARVKCIAGHLMLFYPERTISGIKIVWGYPEPVRVEEKKEEEEYQTGLCADVVFCACVLIPTLAICALFPASMYYSGYWRGW